MFLQILTYIHETRKHLLHYLPGRLFHQKHSQPAFTCSKLTIETLEQGVKYVQN